MLANNEKPASTDSREPRRLLRRRFARFFRQLASYLLGDKKRDLVSGEERCGSVPMGEFFAQGPECSRKGDLLRTVIRALPRPNSS